LDDGKETRTIGNGKIINTLADDVDSIVDDQSIILPKQGQEMRKHTPWPQPPAPAPRPLPPEPRIQRQPVETYSVRRLEVLEHVRPQKPRPGVPTLREAEATPINLDLEVDQ
jgi:hypothetical protein